MSSEPRVLDALLAGLGLSAALALLGGLGPLLGVELYTRSMMASGIIFFVPRAPPAPAVFLVCTAGSATVAAAGLALASALAWSPAACAGAAAGPLLAWYRLTDSVFPPAASLSVLMAASVAGEGLAAWTASLYFLFFPWLAGHAVLWLAACAVAHVRDAVREECGADAG